ncbi:MAG: phosphoribosylglycinamide formyltransferase [Spirochaetes bacterium]|nr:phosphoribosylglycinamide formyltransferase [Spirochaetota bacterium]
MKRVSYLVSGRGSNFKAIADNIISGNIPAENGVVISNVDGVKAFDSARSLGIPYFFVNPKSFSSKEEYESEICSILHSHSTDLICAAGYMKIISPYFINEFRNRIMNIHPALLPSFPGLHAQKQALDYGVKIAGCTVHFVDEGTDTGPIILQSAVEVSDDDTEDSLSARILREEHRIYSLAVKYFCEDRILVEGRKISINRN